MKFIDPLPVVCEACRQEQKHKVADLLAYRAVCVQCGHSLANVGREMHAGMARASNQMQFVVEPLMDLEEHLGVPLPDHAGWDTIQTKADFIRVAVSYLAKVAPDKADPEMIARVYDQALLRRGSPLPPTDSTPLF